MSALFGVAADPQVGRPRVVIHPDSIKPEELPNGDAPTWAFDPREWDVLDMWTVIHKSQRPRRP